MQVPKSTSFVVSIALLLVGAFVVWNASEFGVARDSAARAPLGERDRAQPEFALAVEPKAAPRVAIDGGESIDASETRRVFELGVGVAPLEAEHVGVPSAGVGHDGTCRVRITVEDGAWFDGPLSGSLTWTAPHGAPANVRYQSSSVDVPSKPRAVEEFTDVRIEGLAVRPVALVPIRDTAAADVFEPTMELRVALVDGAVLEWAPSVPLRDRGPVDIALGGSFGPNADGSPRPDGGSCIVDARRGIELPFTLPSHVAPSTVWVGAEGRQWRAFPFEPQTEGIDVVLAGTAGLRVRHEAPIGAVVVAHSISAATMSRAEVVDEQPIEFADLPIGDVVVFVEEGGRRSSSEVRLELVEGRTAEVDLRAAATLDGLGGVRLVVRAAPELLTQPLSAILRRGDSAQPAGPNHIVGMLQRVPHTDGPAVFELCGLEPQHYSIWASPFGGCVEVDVQAGVIAEVELVIDCIGNVLFEFPPGIDSQRVAAGVVGLAVGSNVRGHVPLPWIARAGDPRPLLCGTYTFFGRERAPDGPIGLTSDPFVVTSGATTVVPLRVTPLSRVEVVAIDAAAEAPIGLEIGFWFGVRGFDVRTNAEIHGEFNFVGPPSACSGVVWTFEPHGGHVRLVVPESPFWTFEPIDAVELIDGATITLRATAK